MLLLQRLWLDESVRINKWRGKFRLCYQVVNFSQVVYLMIEKVRHRFSKSS